MGYGREFKDAWPNDNPFTTTSTVSPLTPADKATQTQTAMLEVFNWLYSSTLKPIVSTMSTMVPTTTTGSFVTDKDEWGNSVETYRVDEPPHSPGLSLECRLASLVTFYFCHSHLVITHLRRRKLLCVHHLCFFVVDICFLRSSVVVSGYIIIFVITHFVLIIIYLIIILSRH